MQVALLIVDMINLFDFEGGQPLARAATVACRPILQLRTRFDRAGAPVIYVNDNFSHWHGDFRDLLAQCGNGCIESRRIAQALAPMPAHFHVLKPKHSGFVGTPLRILLASLGVEGLVITGIAADSCVLATAQSAKMLDYRIWVPGNAIAAASKTRKAEALALIRASLQVETRGTRAVTGLFPG